MKIKRLWVVLLAFVVLISTSCAFDQKKPEKGYLNEEEVLEIVKGFSETNSYTRYGYIGSLNFLGFEEELIPGSVLGNGKIFNDSLDLYDASSSSYYLRMPLHITLDNWTISEEEVKLGAEAEARLSEANQKKTDGEITDEQFAEIEAECKPFIENADFTNTTYYKIQSMLLTIGETLDQVYYYIDSDNNLVIRTFGANKALIIRESDIICHGKWNVTLVYNSDGYLVSEKFETINAHKDPDTESCYGGAIYSFA